MSRIYKHHRVLFTVQKGKCFLCEGLMSMCRGSHQHIEGWTVEHVVPKRVVPANTRDNTVLAHYKCNFRKKDRIPSNKEWKRLHTLYINYKTVRLAQS